MEGDHGAQGWTFRAALAVATLAVLAVGVRAAAAGWWPVGDDGYFALRAHDALTGRPPLLGTASTASAGAERYLHHPGPLQFYLLALPVALLGPAAGTAVGTAALNALAVGGAGLLVRRVAGDLAGSAALAALSLLAWAMGSVYLHSPYGPSAAILPFALYLVAVACTSAGEVRALPVAVLAGSFALQTHLSYGLLVPTLGALTVAAAVGGPALHGRMAEATGAGPDRGAPPPPGRTRHHWLAGSLLLALACWAPPLWEQARSGEHGNLSGLLSAGGEGGATPGPGGGLALLARRLATPTLWLPPDFGRPDDPIALVGLFPSWPAGLLLTLGVLALLAAAVRRGWSRGDRVAVGAAATALVAVVASYVSVLNAPILGVWGGNYVRYLWPVSLWVWFSLGLAAARARGWLRSPVLRRRWAVAALAVCVLAGALTQPVADRGRRHRTAHQDTAGRVVGEVLDAVEGRRPVLVRYTRSYSFWSFGPPVMAELAGEGIPFVVDTRDLGRQVGSGRYRTPAQLEDEPPAVVLALGDPGRRPRDAGRLVARVPADPDLVAWGGVDVYLLDPAPVGRS